MDVRVCKDDGSLKRTKLDGKSICYYGADRKERRNEWVVEAENIYSVGEDAKVGATEYGPVHGTKSAPMTVSYGLHTIL